MGLPGVHVHQHAVGASCTIDVKFSPTGTGAHTGTLTIPDNSNRVLGSKQTVSLTGTGVPPSLGMGIKIWNSLAWLESLPFLQTATMRI